MTRIAFIVTPSSSRLSAGAHQHEGNADLAVGLESADARAMPSAGIDGDEGPPQRIDHTST
jgi:hypothetical protein